MIVDLFAGPGGWSQALQNLNAEAVGIEAHKDACDTRKAAGHATIRADLHTYGPLTVSGLTASPPCTTFSKGGRKLGRLDIDTLCYALADPERAECNYAWHDSNSGLLTKTAQWVYRTKNWVALEQVPAVLPAWEALAEGMAANGWNSVSTGILEVGKIAPVAQTRKRAVLLGSRNGTVSLPLKQFTPPSVYETLGLVGKIGFPRKDDLGTSKDGYRERDWRTTDKPAFTLTGKARSWLYIPEQGEPRKLDSWEAGVLQSFPKSYPWRGSRTSQFQQIADAVPVAFAEALLKGIPSLLM